MRLRKIAEELAVTSLTPELDREQEPDVTRGFASDLLSDVLANAPSGALLVTVHTHMNVLAVSAHAALSGVVFAGGRVPEEEIRRKAVEERIPLFASDASTFDVVGQLYALGLRGAEDRGAS